MYKNVLKISYLKINLCGHSPRAATTFRDPPNKNIEKSIGGILLSLWVCYLCDGYVSGSRVYFF